MAAKGFPSSSSSLFTASLSFSLFFRRYIASRVCGIFIISLVPPPRTCRSPFSLFPGDFSAILRKMNDNMAESEWERKRLGVSERERASTHVNISFYLYVFRSKAEQRDVTFIENCVLKGMPRESESGRRFCVDSSRLSRVCEAWND